MPFGAVEDERHRVRWPPDFDVEVSVLGYREALAHAEAAVLLGGVEVRVIPLRAFGPLKLLAWADRRHGTPRDAEDFCFVLASFWEAETEGILDAHADLFEAEGGDTDLIGARSYGREAARFVSRSRPLTGALVDVLERETADVHGQGAGRRHGDGLLLRVRAPVRAPPLPSRFGRGAGVAARRRPRSVIRSRLLGHPRRSPA